MELTVSRKQKAFIDATADEVLYGGAAGGGKSHGQIIDALLYACKYTGSKQLILRRTYPELERSLIRTALSLYPREIYTYNSQKHTIQFLNGSLIDFGYCDTENAVYQYQSAEYDTIRFDELTHFTDFMYTYLISRLRGANSFPKQIKSGTNPGGVGHSWVKERFIDIGEPSVIHQCKNGTRLFIPAKVQDNKHIMEHDPGYIPRLQNLPEDEQKALLHGIWDLFEGQYFREFDREVHVIQPFEIPKEWRRYRALDYGLDMLACYFAAFDMQGRAYIYKEIYQSGLIVSDAAKRIKEITNEDIRATLAPPDLWGRTKDTGKAIAELFSENGVSLQRVSASRIDGWMNLREWLRVFEGEDGEKTAALKIFSNCTNLIRCLPALRFDEKDPNDCATEPHELTHAPDAIRYLLSGRPSPNKPIEPPKKYNFDFEKPKPHALGLGMEVKVI